MNIIAIYAVNEAGVNALRETARHIIGSAEQLDHACIDIEAAMEENPDALGPHASSLANAVYFLQTAVDESVQPCCDISSLLLELAEEYEDIISNNRFGANGSSENAGGGTLSDASSAASSAEAVKQAGKQWTNSLSPEQYAAVKDYTGTQYHDNINGVLRNQESTFDPGNYERTVHIHSALCGSSIPQPITVYRGAPLRSLGKYADLSDDELVGKIIDDQGFMSTSINIHDSFAGDIKYEIDVPSGAPGAYVGYLSQSGEYESEVLFDYGRTMKIKGVRRDSFGNKIICVTMLI